MLLWIGIDAQYHCKPIKGLVSKHTSLENPYELAIGNIDGDLANGSFVVLSLCVMYDHGQISKHEIGQ